LKATSKILFVIFSGLLIHCDAAAQGPAKIESAKPPVPQIDINARFRSLDSTTPISLADYRGKVIVLMLWASWCAPCRMGINRLVDLQKEFANRGVEVILLSTDDPRTAQADARRFVAGIPAAYKIGWIGKISADRLMAGKDVLPQVFVIKDAVILGSFLGWHPSMTIIGLRKILDKVQEKKPPG
jgi:thiol-disulfide isomerase/thioredoxin